MVVTAQEYTDSVPVVLNSCVQYSVIGLRLKEKSPQLFMVWFKKEIWKTLQTLLQRKQEESRELFID